MGQGGFRQKVFAVFAKSFSALDVQHLSRGEELYLFEILSKNIFFIAAEVGAFRLKKRFVR